MEDVSEDEKKDIKRGLEGVLEGMDSEKKKRILAAVKENLHQV